MLRSAYVLIGVLVISSLLFVIWALDRDPTPLSPRTTHHPEPEPPRLEEPKPPAPPPEKHEKIQKNTKRKYVESLGTCSISGVIKFAGERPERKLIETPPRVGLTEPIYDESLVVTPYRTLKNVAVWVSRGLENWEFGPATTPVEMNISGYTFVPHVVLLRVGQTLRITNRDLMQQVLRYRDIEYDEHEAVLEPARTLELLFKRKSEPDYPVRFTSSGDFWMKALVHIVPNPFAVVTDDEGCYDLKGLPPGKYRIMVAHEERGSLSQVVELAENDTRRVDFEFEDSWDSWSYHCDVDDYFEEVRERWKSETDSED